MTSIILKAAGTLIFIEVGSVPHRVEGVHADSVYLLITGIALILVAILIRGMGDVSNRTFAGIPREERHSRIAIQERFSCSARSEVPASSALDERPTVLLSVDVEDYFQTEVLSAAAPRRDWDAFPLRVVENTHRLLDTFDSFNVKATFFMLGWIANRAPRLALEIKERGHELACHSYWHRTIYSMTPSEFTKDTRDACKAIEDASGVRVSGYRAPTWSIRQENMWALNILAEEGFTYDSSIYPVKRDLYGIPGASRAPYIVKTAAGHITEIPPATIQLGRGVFPAAGGGYLRILPLALSEMAIDQLSDQGLLPVVYLHPWEIDPDQPRLLTSWRSRFRQYTGLHSVEWKLNYLLQRYSFIPFSKAQCVLEARHHSPLVTGAVTA